MAIAAVGVEGPAERRDGAVRGPAVFSRISPSANQADAKCGATLQRLEQKLGGRRQIARLLIVAGPAVAPVGDQIAGRGDERRAHGHGRSGGGSAMRRFPSRSRAHRCWCRLGPAQRHARRLSSLAPACGFGRFTGFYRCPEAAGLASAMSGGAGSGVAGRSAPDRASRHFRRRPGFGTGRFTGFCRPGGCRLASAASGGAGSCPSPGTSAPVEGLGIFIARPGCRSGRFTGFCRPRGCRLASASAAGAPRASPATSAPCGRPRAP